MTLPADDLGNELFRAVEERVAAMGRHLGEGAEQDLHEMTMRAAEALLADGPDNLGGRVQEVRLALFELVDKAEELALSIPDYPANLLGEQSYFPAKNWFCPRYPIC